MTLEVAPTSTTNCECQPAWKKQCHFGHNKGWGCSNYWVDNASAPELTSPVDELVGESDSKYLVDRFEDFVQTQKQSAMAPFLAVLMFHNNHIPFVSTDAHRLLCERTANGSAPIPEGGAGCLPPSRLGQKKFSAAQLDYYGALLDVDEQIGRVRQILHDTGYSSSTLLWVSA